MVFASLQGAVVRQWMNVENITSSTKKKAKNRRDTSRDMFDKCQKRIRHRRKFYIPVVDERTDLFTNGEMYIINENTRDIDRH